MGEGGLIRWETFPVLEIKPDKTGGKNTGAGKKITNFQIKNVETRFSSCLQPDRRLSQIYGCYTRRVSTIQGEV